jgi:hypothetical protein
MKFDTFFYWFGLVTTVITLFTVVQYLMQMLLGKLIFEKLKQRYKDKIINPFIKKLDHYNLRIGWFWLMLAEKSFNPSWPQQILAKLDKIFGEKFFSRQAYIASIKHTLLAAGVINLFWIIFYFLNQAELQSKGVSFLFVVGWAIAFFISTAVAIAPLNYASIAVIRIFLKLMRDAKAIKIISLTVSCVFIAILFGVIAGSTKVLSVTFTARNIYDKPYNPTALLLQVLACVITSLSTTIYLWAYLSLLISKRATSSLFKIASFPGRIASFVNKPISFIIAFIGLSFLIISILFWIMQLIRF